MYRVWATSHYSDPPKRICVFTRKTLSDAVKRIEFYSNFQYSQWLIMGPNTTKYNEHGEVTK